MLRNLSLLAARILVAVLFLPSGFQALTNFSGTTGYFGGLGFPMPVFFALAVPLFEIAGGAAILLGLQTRYVALVLAAFTIAAGFIGHYGQGDGDPMLTFLHAQMLMKDIAISGGLLALSVAGAGALSVDRS